MGFRLLGFGGLREFRDVEHFGGGGFLGLRCESVKRFRVWVLSGG